MMRPSLLISGSVVVRPATMAARAPSRLPSAVHLPRCTGGPPHWRLTAEASSVLPKMATPSVTAIASPWVDDDDVTEISIYEVIAWSAEEAMELIKQTPPPPPPPPSPPATHDVGQPPPPSLPAPAQHDVDKLLRMYARLLRRLESQSIDMYAGSRRLVEYHVMAWGAYEATRPALLGLGFMAGPGIEEVLIECISRGNAGHRAPDDVVEPRLLAAFGIKPESLPTNPMERRFVAGILYAAMEMRNCVRRRVRWLRRVERYNQRRREEEAEAAMRREEEERRMKLEVEKVLKGYEEFI